MMTSLVSSIIELLTVNPHVAYLAVFLLALSESIPIIGAVVPGTAVILALSALVPSGVLLLWPLLVMVSRSGSGIDTTARFLVSGHPCLSLGRNLNAQLTPANLRWFL